MHKQMLQESTRHQSKINLKALNTFWQSCWDLPLFQLVPTAGMLSPCSFSSVECLAVAMAMCSRWDKPSPGGQGILAISMHLHIGMLLQHCCIESQKDTEEVEAVEAVGWNSGLKMSQVFNFPSLAN